MKEQGLILLFYKQVFQINKGKRQYHIKNMNIRFIQAIYSRNQIAIRFEKMPNQPTNCQRMQIKTTVHYHLPTIRLVRAE